MRIRLIAIAAIRVRKWLPDLSAIWLTRSPREIFDFATYAAGVGFSVATRAGHICQCLVDCASLADSALIQWRREGGVAMSDLIWLSEAQMRRIEPYFPLSHGVPRVDDRRVISGIIFVIRNGLRWRDAPKDYGPHKTIYNRFIRWSRLGVFNRIFAGLAAKGGKPGRLMIDATHLKAHRTAASLLKKGLFPDVSGAPRAA